MARTTGRPAGEVEAASDNPFLRLRTRTLIPWTIAGGIALIVVGVVVDWAAADLIGRSRGDLFVTVAQLAWYGLLAAWIVRACSKADTDLRRLIGRVPAGYNWLPVVGLLAATMMFSIGSLYVTAYGLSHLAPELLVGFLMALGEPVVDPIACVAETIVAVAIAPVTEETLFRGVLVSRWG